tara:strand:+ start:1377 stop:1781 length:405 start_codon:yes stop_codon:yes gene_type:complete
MIGKLNHVAIAVPDLDEAIKTYKVMLGASISGKTKQPEHGVITAFINLPNTKIELITPLTTDGPLKNFLQNHPDGGIHHICYEVENIRESQKKLVNAGAQLVGNGKPTIGAHGKPVIFLHPKNFNGTLIELEER